ncbi:MAG: DUF3843 family protein [bacterium]
MKARTFRPPGVTGRGAEWLGDVTRDVKRLIKSLQGDFLHNTLRLNHEHEPWISAILAEFAEDLHYGIGIWRTYEEFNRKLFKTQLPMTGGSTDAEPRAITADRVRHLLWVLYAELNPDLILAPNHSDLAHMAGAVAELLASRMASAPRTSDVKTFMDAPNEHGWDIKRKLVWLGTSSYFFRTAYRNYAAEQKSGADQAADVDQNTSEGYHNIGQTDDFICQECTQWSGLGVTDVLADMLPISDERCADLRSWDKRHAAFYRVDAIENEILKATNLINDQPYTVMMGDGPQPFKLGGVIFGSLVPWGVYWYWSGVQKQFQNMSASDVSKFKTSFSVKTPHIVYRYCKDMLAKAIEANERHAQGFLKYHHGMDLVVYPDGLSMAADEQKRYRLLYETEPRQTVDRVMAERELKHPWPEMKYPDNILNSEDGIGLYYDRQEGVDMMLGFNHVASGFAKKGCDLTNDETGVIKEFVRSRLITPDFVRRMVQEHGDASIRSAFLLRDCGKDYALEYLLRRYKGAGFREVYPNITLVS